MREICCKYRKQQKLLFSEGTVLLHQTRLLLCTDVVLKVTTSCAANLLFFQWWQGNGPSWCVSLFVCLQCWRVVCSWPFKLQCTELCSFGVSQDVFQLNTGCQKNMLQHTGRFTQKIRLKKMFLFGVSTTVALLSCSELASVWCDGPQGFCSHCLLWKYAMLSEKLFILSQGCLHAFYLSRLSCASHSVPSKFCTLTFLRCLQILVSR